MSLKASKVRFHEDTKYFYPNKKHKIITKQCINNRLVELYKKRDELQSELIYEKYLYNSIVYLLLFYLFMCFT